MNSDLDTGSCVAWKAKLPEYGHYCESSRFYVSGSETYFIIYDTGSPAYDIYLCKATEERIKKSFRVVTFIDGYQNYYGNLSITTVESREQKIGSYQPIAMGTLGIINIFCMFLNFPSTTLIHSKNEATNLENSDAPLNPRQSGMGILSIGKPLQAAPDISHDLESLSSDLCNLLKNKAIPDVTLRCEGASIPAHRAVLAARSEVFAAMFQNSMLESKTGIVDVPDMDSSVVTEFLTYVYSGKLTNLSDDTLPNLYAAGDKYAVKALMKVCSERMIRGLTTDNCLDFLILADAHNDSHFKNTVINFIVRHLDILKGQTWARFNEQHPQLANNVYQTVVHQKCFDAKA